MNLRTYQIKPKKTFKNVYGSGFYAQVVMIHRRESNDKKEKDNTKNITYRDNKQQQDVGLILIMIG